MRTIIGTIYLQTIPGTFVVFVSGGARNIEAIILVTDYQNQLIGHSLDVVGNKEPIATLLVV